MNHCVKRQRIGLLAIVVSLTACCALSGCEEPPTDYVAVGHKVKVTYDSAECAGTCENTTVAYKWKYKDAGDVTSAQISPSGGSAEVGTLPWTLERTFVFKEPGEYEAVAKCDSDAYAVCAYVTCIGISTLTEATVPTDRSRKKLGVAEKVTLTIQPAGLTPVSWALSGSGNLSDTSGSPITFTAHERASTPTVTATYGETSCSVAFEVVEPSDVMIERQPDTDPLHEQGYASSGFKANVYIQPADVSFCNISVREGYAPGLGTGYFDYDETPHGIGSWNDVGDVVAGKGSLQDVPDYINQGSDNHTPYEDGMFVWAIPWSYKVGTGEEDDITTIYQVGQIDDTGAVTITKGRADPLGENGDSVTSQLDDPTTSYPVP